MVRAISAKAAYALMKRLGLCFGDDGTTFYAIDEENDEIYEFDSKVERDNWVKSFENSPK